MKKERSGRKFRILPMVLALLLTTGQSFVSSVSVRAEDDNGTNDPAGTTGGERAILADQLKIQIPLLRLCRNCRKV